jgi:hypothetical protein
MLERPEMGGDILSRFADSMRRYNAGFYQFDSIRAGKTLEALFREESIDDAVMLKAERAVASAERRSVGAEVLPAQLAALPRPEGLLEPKIDPTHGQERHVSSGCAFWDDAGLHLS